MWESNSVPHHGKGVSGWGVTPPTHGEAQTYWVSFPNILARLWCPVEGCQGGVKKRTNIRVHFVHLDMWDTIVIIKEGNWPCPICPNVTCLSRRSISLSVTLLQTFFAREMSGSTINWKQSRQTRGKWRQSPPTGAPLHLSPTSSTLGGSYRRQKIIGRRWCATSDRHRKIGSGWHMCWVGRGRMPRRWGCYMLFWCRRFLYMC